MLLDLLTKWWIMSALLLASAESNVYLRTGFEIHNQLKQIQEQQQHQEEVQYHPKL